jgi:hypothetical protein
MTLSAKPSTGTLQVGKCEASDTNHDTNQNASDVLAAEVIENMVGTRRLELLTSTVSR